MSSVTAGQAQRIPESWRAFATALAVIVLTLPMWSVAWNVYDGGIAAAAAGFTLHGLLPYRDYWLLYGPLAGWLLAIPTAFVGPSVELTRVVGLASLIALAIVAYRLCRRWAAPFSSSILAVAAALVLASFMGLETGAWTLGMLLALAAFEARLAGARPWIVGAVIGMAFLARLDVGAYALLASILWPSRRQLLAGFVAVVLPIAIVTAVLTPISSLAEQLIWYPLVGPRAFRGLPGLHAQMPSSLALSLTAMLAVIPRFALVVALIRSVAEKRRDLMVIATFGAFCQLQTLGRIDAPHLAVAATPAIVTIAGLLPKEPRKALVRTGLVVSAFFAASVLGMSAASSLEHGRDVALQRAIEVVRASTGREDPILVGLASNRYTLLNSELTYYLADRTPGTRWTMYNPGVTNTDVTQAAMVRELEATATNIMILDTGWAEAFEITNDSRFAGSVILDTYVRDRFRAWCDFGSYLIKVRTSWNPDGPCPSIAT